MRFCSKRLSISGGAPNAFAGLLLMVSGTNAQETDASPEASVAGVWRVIAAKPAPWIKPHKLDRREAPLLEDAFVFSRGEVKGPRPLGCRHAKFATTVVEPAGLFEGN